MSKRRMFGLAAATAMGIVAIAAAPPGLAHHSFAMFDNGKETILDGVVSEFQWSNPHTWIRLTVTEAGRPVEYAIETPSPNDLTRRGWTRTSLKPGDRIKVTIHPLRDGSKGGSFVRAALADGRTLTLAN